jgi:S-DNA-T family DNA segregation ATPase FtsK/SpoIIIE
MEGFELPALGMLTRTSESASKHKASDNELRSTARVIAETLATFDIPARVVDWIAGPTVTLFEVEIAKGVRLSKITALADDLALALAASTVRILAPIPGKSLIGIEVPNVLRSSVTLGDVLAPSGEGGPLLLGIGKDVAGDPVLADLATMPHLLIGGTTGSGKSVAINAMLMSIMMRSTPAEVRLILIDPKRVELSLYNGVPHLYVPVVTEPKEAASALAWAVTEMERRLKVLQVAGARNIGAYNAMVQDGKGPEGASELPYLCIVIDELADLLMVAAKEVEDSICRIAQLARAAGIHLIVATQRPEANVVTGLIKANITNRIAFNVASGLDSRVVLDQAGAEKLVGLGDMLFSTPAWPKPKRIQGCFVSEEEIQQVVDHLKSQAEPDYHEEILHLKVSSVGGGVDTGEDDDPLLWEAADIVVTSGLGSTSMLQRRLKVGYARAGRIMDMLESKGVVGPPDGSKPREVVVDIEDLESIKVFERQDEGEAV